MLKTVQVKKASRRYRRVRANINAQINKKKFYRKRVPEILKDRIT